MHLSKLCIERPVGTSLLALGVALVGAVSFFQLPVAPLPQVDFPVIVVRASLPGSDPDTMATAVATPLERTLGRIAGVNEITSSSSAGNTSIVLQFDLERDINGAARDVQAAIAAARSSLPSSLRTPPTYSKANPANAPVIVLALTSDTKSRGELYDVASTILAQKISNIPGVGEVNIGGGALPAVRVAVNPLALNNVGLSMENVRATIASSNTNSPKGEMHMGERRWQVTSNNQLQQAKDYIPLIISQKNGNSLRLGDVANVSDSVEDIYNAGYANGKQAVMLTVTLQAGANIIKTVDSIKAELPSLRASIPPSVDLDVTMDRSPTIRASIREVEHTLLWSAALVVFVVFLFLHSFRTALIPSVAVPLSLIGTFAAMYLLGFSLNILSLMALTVATGFVVDDAIVVLENISRHMEKGKSPAQAAWDGVQEVGFTVLSMSLSLVAVFVPILFMGGLVGRLFREFSVTLAMAVLISMVVSLTVTPMLCALFLRPLDEKKTRIFRRLQEGYLHSVRWAVRHRRLTMLALLVTIVINVFMFIKVPKSLMPQQDTRRMIGSIQTDQGISFQSLREKLTALMGIVRNDPDVASVVGFVGGRNRAGGTLIVALKDHGRGQPTSEQVIARLRPKLAKVAGATVYFQVMQDIRFGGRSSGAQYQYTLQSSDLALLREWEAKIRVAFSHIPTLADVNTDANDKGNTIKIDVRRDELASRGLTMREITSTLDDSFSQRPVSALYEPLNQYRVILEATPSLQQSTDTLDQINVLSQKAAVPLPSVSSRDMGHAPQSVQHQGLFAATTISFNLPPGVALSQAQADIEKTMAGLNLPTAIQGGFQGTAKLFQSSTGNQSLLLLAAVLVVYLVLGILYESTIHPITILSTLPSAMVGALLAITLFRTDFTIITLIGVILLIGIVKKNAIMMVDVAISLARKAEDKAMWHGLKPGASASQPTSESKVDAATHAEWAILESCRLRFRPIMMTTASALCGAIPLAISSGAGSEFRQPLGLSIVGGLLLSQLLTLYTTPVVYLYLERFRLWMHRTFQRPLSPLVIP